jgi:hypothetical protein
MTITLKQEEVKFLASDTIGRLAASTPRSVKRLINCYRLVRTRLEENGESIMGREGRPRLCPIIALTVAIETGQQPEIAAELYPSLIAEKPGSLANGVLNAPDTPLGKVLSASELLRNAFDYAISEAGDGLTIKEILQVARISRRFSFNPPG